MIQSGGETLFPPRILRRRESAAQIARDDLRGVTQFAQRPFEIVQTETAAFPICDRIFRAQTIQIDRDINCVAAQFLDECEKTPLPILPHNRTTPFARTSTPIVRPRMQFQSAFAFRAPISENSARPPALEISAAPHARFIQPPHPHFGGRMSQSG